MIGLAAALAVRRACAPATRVWIKWPNDIVDRDGAKLAGLLVETAVVGDSLAHAVVGVGINVNWPVADMPREIRAIASSLCEHAGHTVDRVALLERLLAALDEEIRDLERGISPVARFAEASWLDGRDVMLASGDREVVGTVAGLDADGALLLDTPEGRRSFSVGEVQRVRPALGGKPAEPVGPTREGRG